MEYIEPMLKILLINILLSGDNAVVIAMASRNLPENLQGRAIKWGTFGAITLRILFTVVMIGLLQLPYIQLVGGILLLFISYKLLVDKHGKENIKSGETLQEAVLIIILADVIMSLDNVLAIAAIAGNNLLLIIVGIFLSIPIILTASELILRLIQRFPAIVFFGAALLAWTAGEMMLKENMMQHYVEEYDISKLVLLTSITILPLVIGAVRRKMMEN